MHERTLHWMLAAMLTTLVAGCAAPQGASKAISRERIESGEVAPADELRVAEYLNYYEQRFPEPADTRVGLDLRVGNPRVPEGGGTAWLQIGLQARSAESDEIAPLNVALVVDASGSMAVNDKMPYVRDAIGTLLDGLAPNDRVALVAYSDTADVITSSREVGDGRWIAEAAGRLVPGGSTNLYDGLMTGLAAIDDHYDLRRNNLVILLSDGIANVGETDPARIAADAARYDARGIHVATIGLGHEFNDALLSDLAHQSGGTYQYLDRPAEIGRVFGDLIAGTMQKAASDVVATIHPGPGVRIVSLTGHNGRPPSGDVQVPLQDMGTGSSQVLLAELALDGGRPGSRDLATVELRYRDLIAGRDEVVKEHAAVDIGGRDPVDPLWDTEVLRNVTIQRSAEGLKEIDRLYRAGDYQEAWELASCREQDLRSVADLTGEDQLSEDADLMRTYQETLSRLIYRDTGDWPRSSDTGSPAGSAWHGRLPTATPSVLDVR